MSLAPLPRFFTVSVPSFFLFLFTPPVRLRHRSHFRAFVAAVFRLGRPFLGLRRGIGFLLSLSDSPGAAVAWGVVGLAYPRMLAPGVLPLASPLLASFSRFLVRSFFCLPFRCCQCRFATFCPLRRHYGLFSQTFVFGCRLLARAAFPFLVFCRVSATSSHGFAPLGAPFALRFLCSW